MPKTDTIYDVIVVGGGHAGCEAALAAARLGAQTLFLTINLDHIAQMSCNPAIGGIAKGQLVCEIDALGGEMGLNTDASSIQFRMLNRSKGPAVRSPRAQCDKLVYQRRMKHVVERQPRLHVHQAQAVRLVVVNGVVNGVRTELGETFRAKAFVLCPGTFLRGKLHYGMRSVAGGRAGDPPAVPLSESLRDDLHLEMGRLKTGTPPRVLARSVDFDAMERQDPDPEPYRFSRRTPPGDLPGPGGARIPQMPCYVTTSTAETAQVVHENLDKSPMYAGRIEGIGARYCPSFEDKIVRFPHHETHQIYLEPEGYFTDEYYLNGISTSLPPEVQVRMLHSLPGLEHAEISRYAYAIEYDFVFPHQLRPSLALRNWPNVFLAGQINGTSGYEEAAAQGLLAGINAADHADGTDSPLVLGRDQAYIGVLIDDLITKDITEPYRMFTSRAEYRLLLRQDNADRRLMPIGHRLGLISDADFAHLEALDSEIGHACDVLREQRHSGTTLWDLLKRPDTTLAALPCELELSARAREQIEIEARYEGYISRSVTQALGMQKLREWRIPPDFDFDIKGLRAEAVLKLQKVCPVDLAQAARIDGVTPAEIALLQVHLRRA